MEANVKPSNILAICEVKVTALKSFLIHLGGEHLGRGVTRDSLI